ncbi:ATPase domain of HSP90 chaperone/DNA topoisomerase II/histidine kinase protein [Dioscorea alata]|uniref:ATPase domain of HSP90 chaperone/DNA topoisomerase II/histidine kinase protein n=1 Tax=Dioscorea alata TaxID=55571 RepID=A0ACB7WEI4_DIOAL|nr:ATPase domain of HSP90 chaperone/DNA topoisomerase II/histidine kinase protein [Dioscorea alata]
MNTPDIIDLSSDEETEALCVKDIKPHLLSVIGRETTSEKNDVPQGSCGIKQEKLISEELLHTSSAHNDCSLPFPRQFWRSGEYETGKDLGPSSLNSQNRLSIHPKFLHSNATSHKWAFGAIAELLDNAIDEVKTGATSVIVDKFTDPRNGTPALLIQDDGGGMDPESLRRCMSFGFSDKLSDSSIGQYGNGFKTSTMRLGADVLVFSRCVSKGRVTQSIGLLSYTFLRKTGCDDIIVPVIDYEFNSSTGKFERLHRHGQKHFSANLSTILKWSMFTVEDDLLNQFNDIGPRGSKIIIFNLWFNDDGNMELDFETDPEDILISGSHKIVKTNDSTKNLKQKHVANRLRYSFRVYSSVLYLHMPINFKIVLRGRVVDPHSVVSDLKYVECIKYKPQVDGITESEVVTFIGFLEDAPNIDVHGFSVYHKNRLILPFWKVANNSYGKGRGVVGVLEANFIKPTHDKQDFEKSNLYQKLETRLKEMTYEYWDYHCHLVGYTKSKAPVSTSNTASRSSQMSHLKSPINATKLKIKSAAASQSLRSTEEPSGTAAQFHADEVFSDSSWSASALPEKRRYQGHSGTTVQLKKPAIMAKFADSNGRNSVMQAHEQQMLTVMAENKSLLAECRKYEETEKQLVLKVSLR